MYNIHHSSLGTAAAVRRLLPKGFSTIASMPWKRSVAWCGQHSARGMPKAGTDGSVHAAPYGALGQIRLSPRLEVSWLGSDGLAELLAEVAQVGFQRAVVTHEETRDEAEDRVVDLAVLGNA